MSKYIGLDLSTVSTGYSIFDGSKLIEYGKIAPSTSADTMDRIMEIVVRLEKVIQQHEAEVVTIEDVFYGSNYLTTKMLNRLAGAVFFMLKENYGNKARIQFVMPTDARKCFGLLPKSKKNHVIGAVNAKYDLTLGRKDDDTADAIVVGFSGIYKDTNGDEQYKKSEQKFFKTKVMGLKTPPMPGLKPRK